MDLTYCRLCLQLSKHEFSVFDLITTSSEGCMKLSEMIYTCVNLMIKKDDNLIQNICDPCINDVIRCYNFRRKCHESDKLLNMKIGGILNENSEVRIKIEHEEKVFCNRDLKICTIKEELDGSIDTDVVAESSCSWSVSENSAPENQGNLFMQNSTSELDILKDCTEDIEKDTDEILNNITEISVDVDSSTSKLAIRKLSSSKKVKGKREYKCTVCLKVFKNVTLLRLHSELHSERNNYLCVTCGQGFKQKQCLRAHIVRKHTARFKCHICSKTYVGNSQLFAHIRGHTGERPFSCETCGAKFARKYSVDIHMRTHTGERPFKCRYCEKTFIMHSHRRNHELNHMDPAETENFSCVVCHRAFKRKDLYNLHLKIHSEERNEKCKYCNKKFKSRKSLSSHVRLIHKAIYKDGKH